MKEFFLTRGKQTLQWFPLTAQFPWIKMMSLALISVRSSESQLLHNTMSLVNRPYTGLKKKNNPLRRNFIYFLLTTVSKETLLGL